MEHLNITKPKRRENGTYAGSIFLGEKNRFELHASNSVIVSQKDISEAEKYIYIKNRKVNNIICDLNKVIIDIVKENCDVWFKNSVNSDLIEEYFTNTIVYDRKYGDLIRLKVIDLEHDIPLHKPVDVSLTLLNIRFYKQKFVIEWTLDRVETSSLDVHNLFDESEEEEEVAEPLTDDMYAIREEYIGMLQRMKEEMREKLASLETRMGEVEEVLEDVQNINSEESFFKACARLENFLA